MAKDSDSWIAILLGIIGLVALAKALDEKRCKNCGVRNPKEYTHCKNCGGFL